MSAHPTTQTPASLAQPPYDHGCQDESIELRGQRLGTVVRELAAKLVEERRRRLVLAREVRELRTRLAAYEATDSRAEAEHDAQPQR